MTIVFNHVNICLSWFFFCSRFEVTANLARIHSYGERSNLLEVFGRRFWHRSCPLGQLAQRWRWWTRWTRWTLHWMCQGPTWRCASRLLLKHVETGRWRLSGLPKHWLSNCGRWKSFFSVFQVFHLSLRGELVPVNVWKQRSSRDVYTGNEKKTDQAVTLQLHSCGMLRYFMGFPWFPMSWTRQSGCDLRYPCLPTWWIQNGSTLWSWASRSTNHNRICPLFAHSKCQIQRSQPLSHRRIAHPWKTQGVLVEQIITFCGDLIKTRIWDVPDLAD